MSESPITPAQQTALAGILMSAHQRAQEEVSPGSEGIGRLIKRRREFDDGFVALYRRLTAKLPDYTLARPILGGDFVTPEEIMTARPGVIYSDVQIAQLAEAIPSEEDLRWCKANGYAVMAAPPGCLSLLSIRMLKDSIFYSKTGGWYADKQQKFAYTDKTTFGWLAIRKTEVPKSRSKNWDEQSALISNVEYVPNAAEMSWFITTFFEVRGVRLFEKVYVRTSSLDSGGGRVVVGGFDAKGLRVSHDWEIATSTASVLRLPGSSEPRISKTCSSCIL